MYSIGAKARSPFWLILLLSLVKLSTLITNMDNASLLAKFFNLVSSLLSYKIGKQGVLL